MIIIVFGLPGSGKSYFAERLAEKLHARHISTDALRKKRFPNPEYTEQEKMQVYGMMIQAVRLHSNSNSTLVLDGTFYRSEIRDTFSWTADKMGNECMFIEVKADEKTIKERTGQQRDNSDADYQVYLKVKEEFEPMEDHHLVLKSANNNIAEMLDKTMYYLEGHKIHSF